MSAPVGLVKDVVNYSKRGVSVTCFIFRAMASVSDDQLLLIESPPILLQYPQRTHRSCPETRSQLRDRLV
jgi:hypothetical protein